MNKEHVVVLIVGKTSCGKTSLVKKVCAKTGWTYLKSYTTRPQRNEDDTDHIFIDEAFYLQKKASGEIVAETNIAGYYYFSTIDQIYEADYYTIDPRGKEFLESMNLPNIRFVTVYIKASYKDREFRAEQRGDDKYAFRTRTLSESQQFREFVKNEKWDYSIDNSEFAKAYSVLRHMSNIEGVWKNHNEGSKE